MLIFDVLEAQSHEDAGGRIGAGQRVGDDMVDLSAGDSMFDQGPGTSRSEPVTTELGSDFIADFNGPPSRRSSEATGADKPPSRGVDEELHGPRTVRL